MRKATPRSATFSVTRRGNRRGAASVEMALGLPVFFTFVLGIILLGHMYMVNNQLQIACRNGARLGSVEGTTTDDVEQRVLSLLSATVPANQVDFVVKDVNAIDVSDIPPQTAAEYAALPDAEVADLEARRMFVVRVTVDYGNIALLPVPYLQDITLVGQTFARHE